MLVYYQAAAPAPPPPPPAWPPQAPQAPWPQADVAPPPWAASLSCGGEWQQGPWNQDLLYKVNQSWGGPQQQLGMQQHHQHHLQQHGYGVYQVDVHRAPPYAMPDAAERALPRPTQDNFREAEAPALPWMSRFPELPEEPEDVLVVNSESSGAYASLCADASEADLVVFDAEWVPDWTEGSDNEVSVLQLAFPMSRRAYVLQLGRLGRRLPPPVQMMLVNPAVVKVGFAVDRNDVDKFVRSGIAVTRVSIKDIQERCASRLGVAADSAKVSLYEAASKILRYQLNKDPLGPRCSDWSREELTPGQVRYAALDAWVTLRLYYHLGTPRWTPQQ